MTQYQLAPVRSAAVLRGITMAAMLVGAMAQAQAATYYFSDCASGAATGCRAGSNANAGTDPAAPKLDMTGIRIKGGDVYRFAQGGAWANVNLRIYAPDSTAAVPTVFEDYTPPWATTGAKPIFNAAAGKNAIWFYDTTTAVQDEGYVLRNLDLRGANDGTGKGVVLSNDVDHVTAVGLSIKGFGIGVHVVKSDTFAAGSDGISSHFTLRSSVIANNAGQGLLGSGYKMLIEGNTFDNNGFGAAVRNHNLYLSEVSEGVVVRGNTLTNSTMVNGMCQGVSLVAHGWHPNLLVENNVIVETATYGNCWGIVLDSNTATSSTPQNFSGLVIRGNRVMLNGDASTGIGCSVCPGALIENNHVVRTGGTGSFFAIRWPTSDIVNTARGDVPNGAVTVRNNSVYIDSPSRSHVAIRAPSDGSSGDVVSSNLVVFAGASPTDARCFDTGGRAASAFRSFDNNFCGRTDGQANWWSATYNTLASARSAGFDVNGLAGEPRLQAVPSAANGWAVRIRADSPAIGLANRSFGSPIDSTGQTRDDRPDTGAVEVRAARRPMPPSAVSAN